MGEIIRKGSTVDSVDGEQLTQVGGHGSVDKTQAMQVSREGLVMKPIQEGVRGEREVVFFKTVSNSSNPHQAWPDPYHSSPSLPSRNTEGEEQLPPPFPKQYYMKQ